jgi:glycosyltransferase involved in cell wall biosynthesis
MRIAEMLSVGSTNGAARHCLALSADLAARGHEVVLFHRRWLDVAAAQAAGVACVEFEFERTPGQFTRTLRLLRAHGVQVVHTHMSAAHAYGVILRVLGGPPVVATAHARHLQPHWPFNDLVIAPREATARYHRRVNLVPARRLVVIPSFLGAQRVSPATPVRREAARAKLGVAPSEVVIGQVADIHFEKRQSDLARAFGQLLALQPNSVLALKGAPIDRREVRRLELASRGIEAQVRRLDRAGEVAEFLDALDIFVVSSVREEGPMVAIEAMLAGLPVVSTRVGRMPDLLADGASGLLVAPRDITGLAQAMQRLVVDAALRQAMGLAARQRALAEQDADEAVGQIEAALARVADSPASSRALR